MRQLWFHFSPGVGGDGLVNLLEHAWTVKPVDHQLMWRVHRVVDNQVKFFAATIDRDQCFRTNPVIYQSSNRLYDTYIQNINNNRDMIIASHDVGLTMRGAKLPPELLIGQENILIKTRNPDQAWRTGKIKNLNEMDLDIFNSTNKHTFPAWADVHEKIDCFDHVFYIEDITQTWIDFMEFLNVLHLNIDRIYYDQYQQIISGDISKVKQNVDHYSIYIENNTIKYRHDGTTQSLSNTK